MQQYQNIASSRRTADIVHDVEPFASHWDEGVVGSPNTILPSSSVVDLMESKSIIVDSRAEAMSLQGATSVTSSPLASSNSKPLSACTSLPVSYQKNTIRLARGNHDLGVERTWRSNDSNHFVFDDLDLNIEPTQPLGLTEQDAQFIEAETASWQNDVTSPTTARVSRCFPGLDVDLKRRGIVDPTFSAQEAIPHPLEDMYGTGTSDLPSAYMSNIDSDTIRAWEDDWGLGADVVSHSNSVDGSIADDSSRDIWYRNQNVTIGHRSSPIATTHSYWSELGQLECDVPPSALPDDAAAGGTAQPQASTNISSRSQLEEVNAAPGRGTKRPLSSGSSTLDSGFRSHRKLHLLNNKHLSGTEDHVGPGLGAPVSQRRYSST